MSTLLITSTPSTAHSIIEKFELKDSIFITHCLIKAREYAKFFNPDLILISEEIQTEENLKTLKSWPLVLTLKFNLLADKEKRAVSSIPGKIADT